MENNNHELKYQLLDFNYTKLFIFTNGSFANNKDMTLQLRFLIVLVEKEAYMEKIFNIQGNIIH